MPPNTTLPIVVVNGVNPVLPPLKEVCSKYRYVDAPVKYVSPFAVPVPRTVGLTIL